MYYDFTFGTFVHSVLCRLANSNSYASADIFERSLNLRTCCCCSARMCKEKTTTLAVAYGCCNNCTNNLLFCYNNIKNRKELAPNQGRVAGEQGVGVVELGHHNGHLNHHNNHHLHHQKSSCSSASLPPTTANATTGASLRVVGLDPKAAVPYHHRHHHHIAASVNNNNNNNRNVNNKKPTKAKSKSVAKNCVAAREEAVSSSGATCVTTNSTTTTTTTTSGNNSMTAGWAKKWRTAAAHILPSAADSNSARSNGNGNGTANSEADNITLLQFLALNSLDLTFPASDVLLKNQRNEWVQLSGHEGAFAPAGPGTIWKKRTVKDDTEVRAYQSLMRDIMHRVVPHFYKEVEWNNEFYIEIQDLLYGFEEPSVMDIKMGTRTFSEGEVKNQVARRDLFEKMVKVDPNAPTKTEMEDEAITKLRYMTFREEQSSSSTLGFRIEALKLEGSAPVKDLKLVKTKEQVESTMSLFLKDRASTKHLLVERLKEIRGTLEKSQLFTKHEIVGSSILIIHDKNKVGAWMIDFAKSVEVPEGTSIDHRSQWQFGNHEDGYLLGLDNLINVLENVKDQ